MKEFMINLNPIAFQLFDGKLEVRWYGIILTVSMVIGLIILIRMGKRKGFTSDDMLELFLWLIPLAVIMARVVYVFANNSQHHYLPLHSWDDFVRSIAIWDGGITIYGGMLGGIAGGFFWSLKKKVKLSSVLDMCVPVLLLCQSLGRWGNFCNQEAFGQAITNPAMQVFPLGVYITRSMSVAEGWYQATFFYEAVANFIAAVAFYIIWRKNKFDGILVPAYLVWYCIVRLCLDHLREDGLLVTKIACAVIIPIGILIVVLVHHRGVEKLTHESVKVEVAEMLAAAD